MDRRPPREAPAESGSSQLAGFEFERDDDAWLQRLRAAERPLEPGRIGPYELIEEISRGAQGIVYRARQPSTGRLIAIKRLLAGSLAGTAVRARFEREVEAACALNHPNIVTVYGLDVVDGQPLLTMEWIDGEPIDRWARRAAAPSPSEGEARGEGMPRQPAHPPARRSGSEAQGPRQVDDILDLFTRVCAAVQHAHRCGVIHRDLKPSNVLVDRAGQPHVLDFGLAKIASAPGAPGHDATRLTQTRDFVGTPAYAAPEQVRGEHARVDVRTDVYALGVMLYEMLTGRLPYGAGLNLPDLLHAIQHRDPAPISALRRGADREIDIILGKALAKDPEQRYASVEALQADIERHLAQRPILAHPPSTAYYVRKWVRRHRAVAALLVTLSVTVLAFAVVAGTLAVRLARQRQAALAARDREATARATAEEISSFVQGILAAARPERAGGREVTARELLDQAAESLSSGPAPRPEVEAAVRNTIGHSYYKLGEYGPAAEHMTRVLELFRQTGPAEAVGQRLNDLGNIYRAQGRLDEALELYQEALQLSRAAHAEDKHLAFMLQNLASIRMERGDLEGVEPLLNEALALLATGGADDDRRTLGVRAELGNVHLAMGRFAEAEQVFRAGLDVARRAAGPAHVETVRYMNNLAVALKNLDRLSEAEELYVEIRRIAAPVYGESHPYVLNAINNHVALLQVRRDLTAAEELCRESLRLATGGEPLPERLTALKHLASILTAQHDYVQAEPAFREALTEHRQLFGNDHPATAVVMAEFGAMLRDGVATAAAYSEAEELLLGALAFFEQKFPPNHPYRAKTIDQLRRLYGPDAMNDPARLAAYDSDPPS